MKIEQVNDNWTRFTHGKTEVWVFRRYGEKAFIYELPAGAGYIHSNSFSHWSLNWPTGSLRRAEDATGELTAHLRALEILGLLTTTVVNQGERADETQI